MHEGKMEGLLRPETKAKLLEITKDDYIKSLNGEMGELEGQRPSGRIIFDALKALMPHLSKLEEKKSFFGGVAEGITDPENISQMMIDYDLPSLMAEGLIEPQEEYADLVDSLEKIYQRRKTEKIED